MGSFGDSNIKSEIEDELRYIFSNRYGKDVWDATAEEKLTFVAATLEVLSYCFGE